MGLFKIIASILLWGFFSISHKEEKMKEKTTDHPTYVYQVIDILEKEVAKEYRLRCWGAGGSMPTDIRSISVKFERKNPATIEEARTLMVGITEKFRTIINEHENIRPFLRDYPFPQNRIEISISFKQKKSIYRKRIS